MLIERRSIDYIPQNERHGKALHQAPFWFLANLNFFSIAMGFLAPSMGLGFAATCLASVLGVLFGTLFMALHASQGPDLGLPQMIQSRAQFGYRGVLIPLMGALFSFVGFNVVDTLLIGQGLNHLFNWPTTTVIILLGVTVTLCTIYGYEWLHLIFKILCFSSLPIYLVLSAAICDGTIKPQPTGKIDFTWVAFATQFIVCASYNLTFAPLVSDFTRYLAQGKSRTTLFTSVYLGVSLSAIWLIILGAWLATYTGASDGLVSIFDVGNATFPHFGMLAVLISVIELIAAMSLNAYSGMMTIITSLDSFVKVSYSRPTRILGVLIMTTIWLGVSFSLTTDALNALNEALTMMFYLLMPWTAINLTDYFLVRKGRYATAEFFNPHGIYGAWRWQGLTAYFMGLLASVPFFNLPDFYIGPVTGALNNTDLSWIPGLIVSCLVYRALMRREHIS